MVRGLCWIELVQYSWIHVIVGGVDVKCLKVSHWGAPTRPNLRTLEDFPDTLD